MRCGSVAVSASAINASRSSSDARTVLIKETSLPGTSWATPPMRAPRGISIDPPSRPNSPRMMRNSVVLPAPLRPTIPTLWPVGTVTDAFSIRLRPSTEYVISWILSMGFHCLCLRPASIAAFAIIAFQWPLCVVIGAQSCGAGHWSVVVIAINAIQ